MAYPERLLFAAAVSLCSSACVAAPITFEWTALVTTISDQRGANLDIGLAAGEAISGTFTYDDSHPDDFALDTDRYYSSTMPMSVSIHAAGTTHSFGAAESLAGTGLGGGIFGTDNTRDSPPTGSLFSATIFDNDATAGLVDDPYNGGNVVPILMDGSELTLAIAYFNIQISDSTTGLFGPDHLLNESLDLANFSTSFINVALTESPNGTNALGYTAMLTSFRLEGDPMEPGPEVVPLPASALALLTSLGAFGLFGNRRRDLSNQKAL